MSKEILLQYDSLKSYFRSEVVPTSTTNANGAESEWGFQCAKRFPKLIKAFDDWMTEPYI